MTEFRNVKTTSKYIYDTKTFNDNKQCIVTDILAFISLQEVNLVLHNVKNN